MRDTTVSPLADVGAGGGAGVGSAHSPVTGSTALPLMVKVGGAGFGIGGGICPYAADGALHSSLIVMMLSPFSFWLADRLTGPGVAAVGAGRQGHQRAL